MEELFGYVESIVFAGETFTVARIKEPRKQELTCIVGPLPTLQPGESVRCQGVWKHHPQYGPQFEVKLFESAAPSDLVGIQKYLESGMIKGVGKAYAERIVKQFGLETLAVIDSTPERLSEVEGLGPKRIESIQQCWSEQKGIRKVMVFLQSFGVSPTFAQKIYKTYGDESAEVVKGDPYVLAKDIRGIGFKLADQIALKMGLPPLSGTRIRAGIEHALWELSNEGHTCYPKEELVEQAAAMLGASAEETGKRLEEAVVSRDLVEEEGFVALKPFHFAEKRIAKELGRLMESRSALRSVHIEKAVIWAEEKLHLKFAEEQKRAIGEAVHEKVHIITGGPGTGKSTIMRAILLISEKLTDQILLAAPTGRAAKRMTEITGMKASTIHSLLEMNFQSGGFKRNQDNPLKCDLLIVDEASMIDTLLFFHLLKAIPSTCRLIISGDVDQLPSVGAGSVLQDLIQSEKIGVTRLTQIFRQAAHSKIVTNAHRINQGEFPQLLPNSDFRFVEGETPEEVLTSVVDLVSNKLASRFHKFEDIQVLSPMKRGLVGTENLNVVLQQALNPNPTPLSRMGRTFHVGDKVMQIRNNYEKLVFNGDIGRILSIDLTSQLLTVRFEDRRIDYQFSEMDDLVLAYAVSIHKSQGSEFPCVVIPIDMSHFIMLQKTLLYTAITRGKRLVILVGSKKAIGVAVRTDNVKKRHTRLRHQLVGLGLSLFGSP